jgi:predicted esterase YcpF (UPF0227 family)
MSVCIFSPFLIFSGSFEHFLGETLMEPFIPERAIFIHGLEGTSQGVKASLFRELYPSMLIPDFPGSLTERMQRLEQITADKDGWTLIGSSLGGLMAAMFTCRHPSQVRKQILLAPALIWPEFSANLPEAVDTPTVVFQGTQDTLIPLADVQAICQKIFSALEFNVVDDDHGLYQTVHQLNWQELLS